MPGSAWDGADWKTGELYAWDGSDWKPVVGGWTWDGSTWQPFVREDVTKRLDESLSPADSVARADLNQRTISDVAALSEAFGQPIQEDRILEKIISESLTPSESLTASDAEKRTISDAASLSEAFAEPATEDRDVEKPFLSESLSPAESLVGSDLSLQAPTNLSMTWDSGLCRAVLDWTDESIGEDGYRVYRDGVEVAEIAADSTAYLDRGASASTSHTWEVAAYSGATEGPRTGLTDFTGTC